MNLQRLDTDDAPNGCICGVRLKDMIHFGPCKNYPELKFARCLCGTMWIIDDDDGHADSESVLLAEPVDEWDILTEEESGYGLF